MEMETAKTSGSLPREVWEPLEALVALRNDINWLHIVWLLEGLSGFSLIELITIS